MERRARASSRTSSCSARRSAKSRDGPPGDTRAFDARDGKKLWEFHTVPRPGEIGHDTWLDDGWKNRSGMNIWGWYMTVDEQRGIVYMPVGGPAANYWGGDRPGNNLFANSIVAVDANTGKYKWHFQTVHHDLWDSDMPSPPTLVDIKQNGRTIPALASVGKTGYMFILDRETGKPIFGVEERPVPKGDVPGEWYSPTQPFPVKPPPLTRVDFNKERDMVRPEDTSPEHVKACQALWDKSGGFYNAGPFTPFMLPRRRRAAEVDDSVSRRHRRRELGRPRRRSIDRLRVRQRARHVARRLDREEVSPGQNYGRGTEGSKQPYDRGSVNGAGSVLHVQRADEGRERPRRREPSVSASAMEPAGCRQRQHRRHRVADAARRQRSAAGREAATPAAAAAQVRSSRPAAWSLSARQTIAAFRAFDAKNGKELWVAQLRGQGNANPITYTGKNGKQYVAIVATDSLQVFALP